MKAYVTNLVFRYLQRDIFNTALLFYTGLCLPFEISEIKWDEWDKSFRELFFKKSWLAKLIKKGKKIKISEDPISMDLYAFKNYLNHDPDLFKKLENRFDSAKYLDSKSESFYKDCLEERLGLIKDNNIQETPIFSSEVLVRMWEVSQLLIKGKKSKLDWQDEVDIILMQQDLFISNFFKTNYNMDSVMLFSEYKMRLAILESEDIALWATTKNNPILEKYFPYKTVHQMLGGSKDYSEPLVPTISNILVPDIGKIPIVEIANFIEKDKVKPIHRMIDDLIEKYDSDITTADIANEVVSQLLSAIKILSPSVGEIAVGWIGNIPSPLLVNPVGIFSAHQSTMKKIEFERDYPWILAIRKLRDKT